MTWLKKVGGILLKVIGVVTGLTPLITGVSQTVLPSGGVATVNKVLTDVTDVADVIITTEQMFQAAFGPDQKKGSEKLAAAVPFVAQILQNAQFMTGKKVKDEAKFEAAVAGITSNFADLLNSIGD